MPEKHYLVTPGPTPVPPEVLAATARPMIHHRSPDFRGTFASVLERLKAVYRTDNDVASLHERGDGGDGVRGRQPLLARRSGARRLPRLLRRALGLDGARLRPRGRAPPLRVGRDPRRRRRGRAPGGDGRREGRLPDALGDVHRGRVRRPVHRRANCRLGRARRGRRDLEPRGGAARDGRMGIRRGDHELAQGPDVPRRPRVRSRIAGRPRGGGQRRRRRASIPTGRERAPRRSRARAPSRSPSPSSSGSTSRSISSSKRVSSPRTNGMSA